MKVRPVDVSIVVVSHNTRALTLACLRSIYKGTSECTFEVIVVDNASSDGSAEAIAQQFHEVKVVANSENRGFAAANNQAMKVSCGEYILLVNPDAEIHSGAVGRTLDFARTHPACGVIGGKVIGTDGKQQGTLFRPIRLRDLVVNVFVPNRLTIGSRFLGAARYSGLDLSRVHEVEAVAGCFMLVRRRILDEVGGLDESFFMYGEEAEWCHRIRRAGWKVCYFPDASILHYGGMSTEQRPDEMMLAMARSQVLLLRKTRGPTVAFLGNLLMLARDLPRALCWQLISAFPGVRGSALGEELRRSAKRCMLHARGLAGFGSQMFQHKGAFGEPDREDVSRDGNGLDISL